VISVAHILGARQFAQALMTARCPTRRAIGAGAAVDALHAATMIAAAAANVGPRRLTMASAATAGAFTAAGVAQSRRLPRIIHSGELGPGRQPQAAVGN
jgi:hypothetical protein